MTKRARVLLCVLGILLATTTAVFASGGQEGGGKVVIHYANIWVREELGNATYRLDLVDQYMKDHPNVQVIMDSTSHDPYLNVKFKTMVAANNLPELFHINSQDMRSTSKAGQLMDWTGAFNADPAWTQMFLPGLFDETTFDGKIYGVPFQFITNEVVFYNSDLVAKAGYTEFPKTWEDFMTLCGKLKDMGVIPIDLGDKGGWPFVSHLVEPLTQYMAGNAWVKQIGTFTGKESYENPRFIAGVQLIVDAIKAGYFNSDSVALDHMTDDLSYYANEKAAIYLGGSYTISSLVQNIPQAVLDKTKMAPIPRPTAAQPEVKYGMFTGGSGWEYAANTKMNDAQKKVVVDLVKFLTGPVYAKDDVEHNYIPVIKMQYVTGWDKSMVSGLQQEMNRMISAAPAIYLMNQQQNGPATSDVLYKGGQQLLTGQMTAEQYAAAEQEVYAKVVADYNK